MVLEYCWFIMKYALGTRAMRYVICHVVAIAGNAPPDIPHSPQIFARDKLVLEGETISILHNAVPKVASGTA